MIKRYALSGRTTAYGTPIISELEHDEGVYCHWEDVEKLQAEIADLKAKLATMQGERGVR